MSDRFLSFRISNTSHGTVRDRKTTSMDWRNLQRMPEEHEVLDFSYHFTQEQMEWLSWGLIPEEMEDRWFIYMDGDKVFFHRSWTGICVYILRLSDSGINSLTVNRCEEQYNGSDAEEELKWFAGLMTNLLLYDDVPLLKRYFRPYMAAKCIGCTTDEVSLSKSDKEWEVWMGPSDDGLPSVAVITGRHALKVESTVHRRMVLEAEDVDDICKFVSSWDEDPWKDY